MPYHAILDDPNFEPLGIYLLYGALAEELFRFCLTNGYVIILRNSDASEHTCFLVQESSILSASTGGPHSLQERIKFRFYHSSPFGFG